MAEASIPELPLTFFATLRGTCVDALVKIDELEARYGQIETRRKELAKMPMEDASLFWHEEKYLYLIGRTVNGYRPRRYIGNKSEKVEEAVALVSNFEEYQVTLAELQHLRNRVTEAQFLAQQLVSALKRKPF